jgi:clan AA aspartic protease (TIGR02281 family)
MWRKPQSLTYAFAGMIYFSCLLGILSITATAKLQAQDTQKNSKSGGLSEDVSRVFKEHGLRIVGSNLTLDLDTAVTKDVKDLEKYKRSLMLADRESYTAEANVEAIKRNGLELRRKHTQLSASLANVNNVVANNRLVGELNATAGLMDELRERQKQAEESAEAARGKVHKVREEFIKALLALRQANDKAFQKWETLAADKTVIAAVETASAETGKKLSVKPPATLQQAETKLKSFEAIVISESIPLENDSGSLWVNVVINGKPLQKMVVDSGASAISISSDLAKKLDVSPKDTDPDIMVGLADGRQIPAKLIKLATVRVGKFTAENVECVVLGEQANNAPPLLGMSFLGQFKIELDTAQAQLKMVKVDSGESHPSTSKSKKKAN